MTSFDISFIDDFWHVQKDGVSISMHSLRREAILARGRYSSETEGVAGCNHWPGQVRCGVCGMGYAPEERRT